MQSLIKHLHAFVREVEPSGAEWFAAIDFLTRTGKMCDEKRQEFILASDVLGVSMLVDAINHRAATGATPEHGGRAVPRAQRAGARRRRRHGEGRPGIPCFVTGKVRGLDGEPVGGAVLDLWQTDGEGLYEAQRDTTEPWMRGLYRTRPDGSLPDADRGADRLHDPDGRHDRRADEPHQHLPHAAGAHPFLHDRAGLSRLVTHLFQRGDEFIETDVVYGVKEPLIVDFKKKPAGARRRTARWSTRLLRGELRLHAGPGAARPIAAE